MPENFAPLQFSTHALPEHQRLALWREMFGRQVVQADIEPVSDSPFKSEVVLRALPGLRTVSCISSSMRMQRSRELVADGDDDLALLINGSGALEPALLGREVSLSAGDAALTLNAEPSAMTYSGLSMALLVPRAALLPLVSKPEDAAMQTIPRDNDALRLLAGYLKLMDDTLPLTTPELAHRVATHIHDLVALAIGATRDGTVIAEERGVRAARLAAIKSDIAARFDRLDLSVVAVAARQRVTPRYVQLLFECEGTTFSHFVLAQRLARAHQMLTSVRHAGWTISAIALAAGFGDLSHFNRSFRRCYGITPSDVRHGERLRSSSDRA